MTVYLNALGIISALGDGVEQTRDNLLADTYNGLTLSDSFSPGRILSLGQVHTSLPELNQVESHFVSRNNQMLLQAYQQIADQVEAACNEFGKDRVAIILGTSTAGIAEGESAFKHYQQSQSWPLNYDYRQQEIAAPALFLADYLAITGPTYTISTACSSGAKALASAKRLLNLGICDAVIAGGVDTLCGLTVQGFTALNALSDQVSNPFSRHRQGINIGEGAALFLLTKQSAAVRLSGVGETSDAHHISAPDPSGDGAYRAMQAALAQASCSAQQVDYINMHGTGTAQNDAMESAAVNRLFGNEVLCSSTKPLTGHCLGASGAIEAGLCWLLLQAEHNGWLPAQRWDGQVDPDLAPIAILAQNTQLKLRRLLSNSFAFGGNNIALLLEANGEGR